MRDDLHAVDDFGIGDQIVDGSADGLRSLLRKFLTCVANFILQLLNSTQKFLRLSLQRNGDFFDQ